MKKMLLLVVLTIISLTVLAEDRAEKLRENLFHNPKYVTVVAHRGDWRNHPENSLPAFQSCIEMGDGKGNTGYIIINSIIERVKRFCFRTFMGNIKMKII